MKCTIQNVNCIVNPPCYLTIQFFMCKDVSQKDYTLLFQGIKKFHCVVFLNTVKDGTHCNLVMVQMMRTPCSLALVTSMD